jgi:acyl dehydratase
MDATYTLLAHNTATESANRMHDDAVARTYGFKGGLVPGVDVYAYLTHVPVSKWGADWLVRGTMSARFLKPVYDGDDVSIHAEGDELSLTTGGAEPCAVATMGLPEPTSLAVGLAAAPLPQTRPPAGPESLAPGTLLGSLEFGFHADKAAEYLDDIGETLPLYPQFRVAHPGWLLRSANDVLARNVVLGPWIHVSSTVTNYSVVEDGQQLSTRARVLDRFERKGHQFVVLEVLVVGPSESAVLHAEHTAIYEPRPPSS